MACGAKCVQLLRTLVVYMEYAIRLLADHFFRDLHQSFCDVKRPPVVLAVKRLRPDLPPLQSQLVLPDARRHLLAGNPQTIESRLLKWHAHLTVIGRPPRVDHGK